MKAVVTVQFRNFVRTDQEDEVDNKRQEYHMIPSTVVYNCARLCECPLDFLRRIMHIIANNLAVSAVIAKG